MSHEAPVSATVEWYTPPEFFARLGEPHFDLDPASPGKDKVPWVPANDHYTKADNGVAAKWYGDVWLNPPYGPAAVPFVDRMIEHNSGLLLIPARTETALFQRAARAASCVAFLRDRLHFVREDGYQARSGFASALMSFGRDWVSVVKDSDLGWMVVKGER